MTSITLFSLAVLGLGACLSCSAVAGQDAGQKPVVVLDTSEGPITIELYPDKAPITVENFLKYVDEGFYDDLIFHRVIPGFMIQGGGMTDRWRRSRAHGADQERVEEIHLQRARDHRHGPDERSRLGDLPVLHQPQGQHVAGLVTAAATRSSARSSTAWTWSTRSPTWPTTTKAGHENVPVKPVYIKSARRKTK